MEICLKVLNTIFSNVSSSMAWCKARIFKTLPRYVKQQIRITLFLWITSARTIPDVHIKLTFRTQIGKLHENECLSKAQGFYMQWIHRWMSPLEPLLGIPFSQRDWDAHNVKSHWKYLPFLDFHRISITRTISIHSL